MFLLPENLLINPVILKCILQELVKSVQPWDILSIYYNNQLKSI